MPRKNRYAETICRWGGWLEAVVQRGFAGQQRLQDRVESVDVSAAVAVVDLLGHLFRKDQLRGVALRVCIDEQHVQLLGLRNVGGDVARQRCLPDAAFVVEEADAYVELGHGE